jgi:hypothetical protein
VHAREFAKRDAVIQLQRSIGAQQHVWATIQQVDDHGAFAVKRTQSGEYVA